MGGERGFDFRDIARDVSNRLIVISVVLFGLAEIRDLAHEKALDAGQECVRAGVRDQAELDLCVSKTVYGSLQAVIPGFLQVRVTPAELIFKSLDDAGY